MPWRDLHLLFVRQSVRVKFSGDSMTQQLWINGVPTTQLDARDRGVAYGDGVFETIRVSAGVPLLLDQHRARMIQGAQRLSLDVAAVDALLCELAQIDLPQDAALKLTLTRGVGGRGYLYDPSIAPTRIIMLAPLPSYEPQREQGVTLRHCETRLGINPALAGIKHLNRLEQVLARNEWRDPDVHEGLVCDAEGFLVEGTMSNLFWRTGARIYTPRVDRCGVDGVIRRVLLGQFTHAGIKVEQGLYEPDLLQQADEIILCNSLIEVWPVKCLDNKQFEKGSLFNRAWTLLQEEYQR